MKLIPLGMRKKSRSKSGVFGVSWHTQMKKWTARCPKALDNSTKFVGLFDTVAEAKEAIEACCGTIAPSGFTQVSDEDYDYLMQFSWHMSQGRVSRSIKLPCGKNGCVLMHREIAARMELEAEGKFVDHIDRKPLNNQRDNLRDASPGQSALNRGKSPLNTTGAIGVSKMKDGRYDACVKLRGKKVWRERFIDFAEAVAARDAKAKEYHGEFAVLNNP